MTPDELVEVVKLRSTLQERHVFKDPGTTALLRASDCVGYNGFFEGDPWQLEPMAYEQR